MMPENQGDDVEFSSATRHSVRERLRPLLAQNTRLTIRDFLESQRAEWL